MWSFICCIKRKQKEIFIPFSCSRCTFCRWPISSSLNLLTNLIKNKVLKRSNLCVERFKVIDLEKFFHICWLRSFLSWRKETRELLQKGRIFIEKNYIWFWNEVKKNCFFLLYVFNDDGLLLLEIESIEQVDMISPKADFDRLKSISDNESNNISLFLESICIFVCYFIFNLLNDSYHIDHLTFNPFVFVLPTIILVFVLGFYELILELLNFVLFLAQTNLRASFCLVTNKQL